MEVRLIAAVAAVLGAMGGAIAIVVRDGERFVGAQEILRVTLG